MKRLLLTLITSMIAIGASAQSKFEGFLSLSLIDRSVGTDLYNSDITRQFKQINAGVLYNHNKNVAYGGGFGIDFYERQKALAFLSARYQYQFSKVRAIPYVGVRAGIEVETSNFEKSAPLVSPELGISLPISEHSSFKFGVGIYRSIVKVRTSIWDTTFRYRPYEQRIYLTVGLQF